MPKNIRHIYVINYEINIAVPDNCLLKRKNTYKCHIHPHHSHPGLKNEAGANEEWKSTALGLRRRKRRRDIGRRGCYGALVAVS